MALLNSIGGGGPTISSKRGVSMTFREFKGYVNGYLKSANVGTKAKFHNDKEKGRFTAKVSGLFITSRPGSLTIHFKTGPKQYFVVRV